MLNKKFTVKSYFLSVLNHLFLFYTSRFINNSQIGPGHKSIVFTSDFFPASVVTKNK